MSLPRRRCRFMVAIGLAAALANVWPAAAADQAQVQRAIEHGRDYLFRIQKDGNWEEVPRPDLTNTAGYSIDNGQWGGMTAVATLSLLASGVDASDPRIKRAVAFLASADVKGIYALGLRAQVWNLLPQDDLVRAAATRDRDLLEQGVRTGKGLGFYGYLVDPKGADFDHSVSQFGVLGMWSLAQQGIEVPTAYWRVIDAAWHRQERRDGSWTYYASYDADDDSSDHAPGLSMTAAGVATLFITQEYTQIAPRCQGNLDDPAIDAGVRWMGTHLDALATDRQLYTLFGISRVGLASGYKYFGQTDWFRWGSDLIVKEQRGDGGWDVSRSNENINAVPDTAFALLFLSRGRLPVMMNKLQYETVGTGAHAKPAPGLWNQRPRDAANLSRWVGRQLESPLNWQVVNLGQSVVDLHEAPILYMAGGRAPKLPHGDVDRLRTYLEDGGLLLGQADCASSDFSAGFRALGEQMFPGRKFRSLELNSPIYNDETFPRGRWGSKPVVDALSNGDRELMLLLPQGDPARDWQSQSFQSVKKDTFGQLMIDLLLYAVDKEGLRGRGETYIVARNDAVPAAKVAAQVARLKYAGNWDPEPGGWRRLANVMHNARAAELSVEPVDIDAGASIGRSYALASLTVAAPDAKLTDAARAAIRDYVRAGGTLLVDAAGGRSLYRAAAEAELAKIFPGAPRELLALPPSSPVYAAAGPALAVRTVDYRHFERPSGGVHVPLLRGYTVGGRIAVFYSPEDVSVGLVGQPIDGVAGYAPADATKVVANVVAAAAGAGAPVSHSHK